MREEPPRLQRRVNDQAISLAREWRMLGRAASAVALLTSPALFFLFYSTYDWPLGWALLGAAAGVVIFRGGVDVIAHKMIPDAAQYKAFSNIVKHESGWDVDATNASSGAYGLVQALPGNKMASAGADWRINPATQIKWGLNYMNSRYGSPCEAWSFWQANSWY